MSDTIIVIESITPNIALSLSNDQGPQGPQGVAGPGNSLSIGTVTTGLTASATITGTSPTQTLNLTLPKGDTGATGATGPQGSSGSAATISVGTVTTGAAGSSAVVNNSGTSSVAVFDFTIPRGDTGDTGPAGANGANGADGATGPQGPSGVIAVTAPITNSGTSTSANIGITSASTTVVGAVQLTDSTSSTSTTTAATPNSVKTTYDLANGKPSLSINNPAALGTVSAGSGVAASKDDHVHPTTGLVTTASLGTGVATFLGTPSSANLASAVTDETGSGSLVFGTGPTLSLPVIDNIKIGYATTLTSASAVTLTSTSGQKQYFTGSTAQTVILPVVSTLALGMSYEINNNSTATITVQSSGLNNIATIPAGLAATFTVILTTGTTAASWDFEYSGFNTATGTGSVVLSASPTFTGTTTSAISSITSYQRYAVGALTTPITANTYSVLDTDTYVVFNRNTAISVTMPTASSFTGRMLHFKTIGTGAVTSAASNIIPAAGGAAAATLFSANTAGKFTILVSDGTNWVIMGQN